MPPPRLSIQPGGKGPLLGGFETSRAEERTARRSHASWASGLIARLAYERGVVPMAAEPQGGMNVAELRAIIHACRIWSLRLDQGCQRSDPWTRSSHHSVLSVAPWV